MGELSFSYRDLYPGMSGLDTRTLANPEADDQQALNEDAATTEKADIKNPSGKKIMLAMLVIVCLVGFLGATA